MEIIFNMLRFAVEDGRVKLTNYGGKRQSAKIASSISEIQLVGENRRASYFDGLVGSSEGETLQYVSHEINGTVLTIVEKNVHLEVTTRYIAYEGTNAVAVEKSIKNISDADIGLETSATLVLSGIGDGLQGAQNTYFYKFVQSHHSECQPRKISLFDYGFFPSHARNFKKLSFANIGSWSTKEELPQGIIENGDTGECLMFQIESNHNWYYEISTSGEEFYLGVSGNASPAHRYVKTLRAGETYTAARCAFCFGNGLNETLENITVYRRAIAGHCRSDESLPVIFNEYMHLAWDSPKEENTRRYAEAVAKTGAEYYVIDCGWHDDMEDGVWVYPYMGKWQESRKNFPNGVRAATDYIRSLGMKAGLWIEPEVVGIHCKSMIDYYGDECFIHRNGKKVCISDKYILDFRCKRVQLYLTTTIYRMIEEYGADYIKLDYNVDSGFVDGDFEAERSAYLAWVDDMQKRFPRILFETCSSGGMRMDYETLKHFSIVSTSDQVHDYLYPYIVGNVLSAVLPEQAAVWSYPVSMLGDSLTAKDVQQCLSMEKIALNMINAMLGRLHLSSDISLISEEQRGLVREGVEVIKKLNGIKKTAMPYFPLGFTDFSKDTVACGLKTQDKIYLAVWALQGNKKAVVPLAGATDAAVLYPVSLSTDFALADGTLTVNFAETNTARFFEITYNA